jgi:hypothetical protein
MDAFVQKLLSLVEDGSSKNDNTSGTISNFIILRSRELNKKSGSLMMDLKRKSTL